MKDNSRQAQYMETLSSLTVSGLQGATEANDSLRKLRRELEYVSRLDDYEFSQFAELANTHHVVVRAFDLVRDLAVSGRGVLASVYFTGSAKPRRAVRKSFGQGADSY